MIYPKITVITPSLNQASFLQQTIESVIGQNYPDLEYLVIDGGSSDNSAEIIKSYEKRLTWWISQPDNGQSDAINKGLKRATGDIISWLNSDDYYEPNILYHVANQFSQNSSINCYIGSIRYHLLNGQTSISDNIIYHPVEKTIGFGRILQPSMFFSRDAINKMGPINTQLQYCFDLEWWLKYLLLFKIDFLKIDNTPIVNFRFHELSKSVKENYHFAIEKDNIYLSIAKQYDLNTEAKVIERYTQIKQNYTFSHKRSFSKDFIKRIIHYFLLLRGNEFYTANNPKAALDYFNMIDTSLLNRSDLDYLNKLKFRVKYIPTPIIKFFRQK